MQPSKLRWCGIFVTCIGAIMAVGGGLLAVFWTDIFTIMMNNEFRLSPNSRIHSTWRKPPLPLVFDVYFFNWTNPQDFKNPDTKPIFNEVGPYRFKQVKEKVNLLWNKTANSISYNNLAHWYFDEENSSGRLNDVITSVNMLALSAAMKVPKMDFLRATGAKMALQSHNVSVTKTARQFLFEGYSDTLLNLAKLDPDAAEGAPLYDKFGWFYPRNGSTKNDGYITVSTGDEGLGGQILLWNNFTRMPFFDEPCAQVKGSMGELFPRNLTKEDDLILFSPDLCRILRFQYEADYEVNGVDSMKFVGGDRILDNGTKYQSNTCYRSDRYKIFRSGLMDLTSCRYGAPIFASFPHFYGADPYYRRSVIGLNPDKEKHSFFIAVHQASGIALELAARFQINILISPIEAVSLYSDVPEVYMPVFWIEQHIVMNKEKCEQLDNLSKLPKIGTISFICISIIGVFMAASAPLLSNSRRKANKRNKAMEEASMPLKASNGVS